MRCRCEAAQNDSLFKFQFVVLLLWRGSAQGSPVAVPEKIFGLTLFLDFFDRCHSLTSLLLPLAALGSLPP